MTTTIYLCRHAEVHNPDRILYGRLPGFGLSRAGHEQAARLAAYLSAQPLAVIYTSPLLRARQTAAYALALQPEARLIIAQGLHEVFTSWQGKPWSQLSGAMYYEPPADPGDETMLDVARRMRGFLEHVVRCHPGRAVAAFSHGDPIAIVLMALHGLPLSERELRRNRTFYPDLASVNRLVFDAEGTLIERTYLALQQLPEVSRL
ncbi:MAG: histidine phosphatase family protein [Chloroflexota bacterium]|nr:histidine phosphatase family protein [Dehalococcoidia bacterium]MDW8253285.1 histidine phosphatase family protein [Chloroflexota bacterium]